MPEYLGKNVKKTAKPKEIQLKSLKNVPRYKRLIEASSDSEMADQTPKVSRIQPKRLKVTETPNGSSIPSLETPQTVQTNPSEESTEAASNSGNAHQIGKLKFSKE